MTAQEAKDLTLGDYIILNEYAPRVKDSINLHHTPLYVTGVETYGLYRIRASRGTRSKHIVGEKFSLKEIKKIVTEEKNPEYFL